MNTIKTFAAALACFLLIGCTDKQTLESMNTELKAIHDEIVQLRADARENLAADKWNKEAAEQTAMLKKARFDVSHGEQSIRGEYIKMLEMCVQVCGVIEEKAPARADGGIKFRLHDQLGAARAELQKLSGK